MILVLVVGSAMYLFCDAVKAYFGPLDFHLSLQVVSQQSGWSANIMDKVLISLMGM